MTKRPLAKKAGYFSEFINDPMIELALLVLALISLMFSIAEFAQAVK